MSVHLRTNAPVHYPITSDVTRAEGNFPNILSSSTRTLTSLKLFVCFEENYEAPELNISLFSDGIVLLFNLTGTEIHLVFNFHCYGVIIHFVV